MILELLQFTLFFIVFIIVLLWILTIKEQLKQGKTFDNIASEYKIYPELVVGDIYEDFQDIEGNVFAVQIFDNNFSLELGQELKVSAHSVITSPQSVVKDILEDELGY